MSGASIRKSPPRANEAGNKEVTVNMRVDRSARDLIDLAAHSLGQTRTDFVLESALASAHDSLLNRCLLPLDSRQFQSFMNALDEPVPPNSELKKLMRRTPVWDEK